MSLASHVTISRAALEDAPRDLLAEIVLHMGVTLRDGPVCWGQTKTGARCHRRGKHLAAERNTDRLWCWQHQPT